MPNTLTIALDPPLAVAGGKLEALNLREPTMKQTLDAEEAGQKDKAAKGNEAASLRRLLDLRLVAASSGVDIAILMELPRSKFEAATAWVRGVTDAGGVTEPPTAPEATVAVDPPVESGGVKYEALTVREPLLREIDQAERAMNGADDYPAMRRYAAKLVAGVTGVPWGAVLDLPVSTVNRAAALCMGFPYPSPGAGAS